MNIELIDRWLRDSKDRARYAQERYHGTLGRSLKEIRGFLKWTQKQTALFIFKEDGKSRIEAIRKWERGRHVPQPDNIRAYLEAVKNALETRKLSDEVKNSLLNASQTLMDFCDAKEFKELSERKVSSRIQQGALDIHLPVPATRIEEDYVGPEDVLVCEKLEWHEPGGIDISSGGVRIGYFRNSLRIGKVEIWPTEEGLHIQFPPTWRVSGFTSLHVPKHGLPEQVECRPCW
jgi:transcriptional regulator with XRE-family HTH domain